MVGMRGPGRASCPSCRRKLQQLSRDRDRGSIYLKEESCNSCQSVGSTKVMAAVPGVHEGAGKRGLPPPPPCLHCHLCYLNQKTSSQHNKQTGSPPAAGPGQWLQASRHSQTAGSRGSQHGRTAAHSAAEKSSSCHWCTVPSAAATTSTRGTPVTQGSSLLLSLTLALSAWPSPASTTAAMASGPPDPQRKVTP